MAAAMANMNESDIDRFPIPTMGTLLLWLQLPLLVLVIWGGSQWLISWLHQPLQDVEVRGDLHHSDAKALRLSVWESATDSYLNLDLTEVKQRLEAESWVYQVDIQRQWPSSLSIEVIEQKPIARWGGKGLLNSEGDVFTPSSTERFLGLPVLQGPETRSLDMMEQYRSMNEILRPLQLKIVNMLLEERGAWTLTFQNGIQLLLGRGDLIDKLQRFSYVYGAQLMPYNDKIVSVDARYTNGLSVEWKEGALAKSASKNESKDQ